jgi:hypothetical protein
MSHQWRIGGKVAAAGEFIGGGGTKQVEGEVDAGTFAANIILQVRVQAIITAITFGGESNY